MDVDMDMDMDTDIQVEENPRRFGGNLVCGRSRLTWTIVFVPQCSCHRFLYEWISNVDCLRRSAPPIFVRALLGMK